MDTEIEYTPLSETSAADVPVDEQLSIPLEEELIEEESASSRKGVIEEVRLNIADLERKTIDELRELARDMGVTGFTR
ncbi:MAG: hypothetical protein H5T33_08610, partial [Candidatus Methanosuratus sp.]|nr:hypothetical protein [Candidatus Methanosuratincola sp.]